MNSQIAEEVFRLNLTSHFIDPWKSPSEEQSAFNTAEEIPLVSVNDKITLGYSNKAKKWKNYINDFSLITLKNAGHYFIKSKAKKVAEIIEKSSKIN